MNTRELHSIKPRLFAFVSNWVLNNTSYFNQRYRGIQDVVYLSVEQFNDLAQHALKQDLADLEKTVSSNKEGKNIDTITT